MIRKLLKECCEKIPHKEVALLLSGGIDSVSIGFALQDAGKKINCYTFHLKDNPTNDSISAKQVADTFDWNITTFEIPTDNLVEDFHRLRGLGCRKKTQIESTYPFLYFKINEKTAFGGRGVDHAHGMQKKCCLHFKEPKSLFDSYRLEYFENPSNNNISMTEKALGIPFVNPYMDKSIYNYFMKYTWKQLNSPREKHMIVSAYKDEFSKIKIRKHQNLQMNTGIQPLFETLLQNPQINYRQRTRVMDVCKDWT